MTSCAGICRTLPVAAAITFVCAFAPLIVAQQADGQRLPYDILMTRDQLEAVRRAWNERLPYVPGEVLVKFRSGVEAAGGPTTTWRHGSPPPRGGSP